MSYKRDFNNQFVLSICLNSNAHFALVNKNNQKFLFLKHLYPGKPFPKKEQLTIYVISSNIKSNL